MKCNEGKGDRIIRVILAIALAVAAYIMGIWWIYIVSAILLITGATGFCILYLPFKINTCGKK
ncbi:TPA: DUF2892 domain-containing protein [candidate division WOR-3 bacterium]|jgi:Flp pilus assembly protein TadB|uniref:DUF2892 domain-containing protein n=1 Tax=candidate division WOR-3 bacterium TaxID=2052148 RepID=A0A350H8I5_UNCW3|nr:DUF2892 domain-containing protein [candidate division WOR-3 bacterium]